ncbi:hypothetical protein HMPREF2942_06035 [Rothia sp. HMSC071C12]|jgi:hypothetical protein|uniref:DUF4244 domain-containing protein n=1 Tax=Rothia TaxID=32207 RepID=UPI00061BBE16|nr:MULTISPECIES: DUF4244 domain-containing protein [Rothia]CNI86550.1 Uncharacterised protein [Mycobacterium tuberculosis]MBS5101532.1 DUF4244 domain-containing protein [Rothia mucilaginosa]OFJ73597.1 hypothetical protein HMPREF2845_01660 [Rothia sp. HMSC065B04]OFO18949.1 hypothetical protein HMPREF3055_03865 [Rothia sp. HMSC061C12]OFQ35504.1 hypothetical protein HMPREF2942_06035 [Rothia sp. HMSC071C12]
MTNTLCEAIRHDLHPVGAPVNAPAGAPSEIQPAALGAVQGAETQTILGPVPLSVAIATTMKQLREECPELFTDAELSAGAEQKHAGPRIDPNEMEIDMNTDRLNPDQALTIARALAEGCTLDECGATCRSLGEHAPGCTEYVPAEGHEKALEDYAPAGDPEEGASTAEYGIVMLAAVGFAGLLVLILKSDEVRSMLLDIVRNALSIAGNTGLL